MEIKVSDTIGFCFGVRQAVDLSNKTLRKRKDAVYSVGPVIHNPQVVKELLGKGLKVLKDIDALTKGAVIVSSHGAGARLKEKKKDGIEIIDATCPFVKKAQNIVKALYEDGYKVIIIGKKEHPEVKGLVDFTDGEAIVIKDVNEVGKAVLNGSKIGVVSQSTYSQKDFLEITSALLEKGVSEFRVFNTICKDTIRRQEAVRRLADGVDVIIIIGGRDSANTKRLVETAKRSGKAVYHIEGEDEIEPSWFAGKGSVGIASGASTPDWVVKAAIKRIKASGPSSASTKRSFGERARGGP